MASSKISKGLRQNVKHSDVTIDEELYPRSIVNWHTVYDYKESMVAGAVFPPIVLASLKGKKGKLFLVDGRHRLDAYKQLKVAKIPAIVHLNWTAKQLYIAAVEANMTHGRQLSPYEKRKIALKLLEMKVKGKDVSKIIQVPVDKLETFVTSRMVNAMTGDEIDSEAHMKNVKEMGDTILKSGLKHLSGGSYDFDIEKTQKDMSMMSQKHTLNQVKHLLEKGLIDTNDEEVMKTLSRIKTLLRKYKF